MKACRAALCAIVATSIAASGITAQDYPSKPIKFDRADGPRRHRRHRARACFSRSSAKSATRRPSWSRTGAGAAGVIGTNEVAKAPPDGYTFLVGNHAVLAMLPHLQKISLRSVQELRAGDPRGHGAQHPGGAPVACRRRTVKELIAYAKANPGKLTYASQGVGASGHIAGELFKLHAGIDITHVPYKGAAPAAQDLAAGHVSMMFDVVSLALGADQGRTGAPARRRDQAARRRCCRTCRP